MQSDIEDFGCSVEIQRQTAKFIFFNVIDEKHQKNEANNITVDFVASDWMIFFSNDSNSMNTYKQYDIGIRYRPQMPDDIDLAEETLNKQILERKKFTTSN